MEHLVGVLDSLPHVSVLTSPTTVLWWVFAWLPHPFAITLIVCGFGLLTKWMLHVLRGIVRSCCRRCKKSRPSPTHPSPASSETLPPPIAQPADLSRVYFPTTTLVCPLCNGNLTVVPTRPEAPQTHLTGQFHQVPTIPRLPPSEELPILTTPPRAYHPQSRRSSFANADTYAW